MIENLKDKILILKIRNGETKAFSEIYDRYATKIYRFIFFKTSRVEETEDLTSEVFLKLWQYLSQEREELRNLKAFLYQMARNQVIDYYRDLAAKQTVSLDEKLIEQVELSSLTGLTGQSQQMKIFEKIEFEEEFENIKDNLAKLKEEYREVLLLKYVEDFSTGEIAEIINKSKGATRVIIHRALSALKEIIKDVECPKQKNDQSRINQ
jgi:RNA polymerase sigma-70 factor (ECF subfamily)